MSWNVGKSHWMVVGALGAVVAAVDLLLVFHPTLGVAQGGILNGADLRWDLIRISWILCAIFCAVSTLVFSALRARGRSWVFRLLAYAAGAIASALSMPIIDKVF